MALPRIPLTTAALALVALVLAVLIGRDVFFPPASNTANSVRTATVVRGTVRSVVSGTGSLVPTTSINVGFKTAGTLTEVDVKVGDRVTAGQVLGKIDATNLQIALDQANAQLASAQANLSSTLNGTSLAQAQHAVDNARQSYSDTVNSVNLTNSQDATQLSTDQNQFNVDNAQLAADQANYWYQQYAPTLTHWEGQLATDQSNFQRDGCNSYTDYQHPPGNANVNCANDSAAIQSDQSHINCVQQGGATCTSQEQQIAAAYKQEQADQGKVNADNSKIAGDQAKVNADQVSGQARINSAQNAITSAQDGLNQQSTQRPATIATQQAAVESAQGAVQTAQNNFNASTLTAPMDGTVTVQNGNVGDNVSASAGSSTPSSSSASSSNSSASSTASNAFVQLSNLATFQIVAPFAEADASRVQVGQQASVSFDAIQGLTEPAHVTLVAPTSTVTSNVVNYSVTFALDQTDPRLRSGMTSNLTVTVASASNVLLVPNSAITRIGTRAFVTILDKDGKEVRTLVTPGVVGDSTTEITAGLQEGDKVVLPQLRTGTATTQAGGRGGFGGGGGGGGIRVGGGG